MKIYNYKNQLDFDNDIENPQINKLLSCNWNELALNLYELFFSLVPLINNKIFTWTWGIKTRSPRLFLFELQLSPFNGSPTFSMFYKV